MWKITICVLLLAAVAIGKPAKGKGKGGIPKPIKELFKQIDTDGSGGISEDEGVAYAEKMGYDISAEIEDIAEFDEDGDGSLSLQEFAAAVKEWMEEEMGGFEPPTAEEIAEEFKEMDANGDGGITVAEATAAMEHEMESPVPVEIVSKLHRLADVNGDGKVTLEEYKQTHKKVEKAIEKFMMAEDLAEEFKEMDADGDGAITVAEATAAMEHEMESPLPAEMISKIVSQIHGLADVNGDGSVTFEEFKQTHKEVVKAIEKMMDGKKKRK